MKLLTNITIALLFVITANAALASTSSVKCLFRQTSGFSQLDFHLFKVIELSQEQGQRGVKITMFQLTGDEYVIDAGKNYDYNVTNLVQKKGKIRFSTNKDLSIDVNEESGTFQLYWDVSLELFGCEIKGFSELPSTR